jgi:Transcription factor WhiB
MTTIAARRPDVDLAGSAADGSLWNRVITSARCAESVLDPDDWFPVSPEPEVARLEADAAIVICMACPVRVLCLELSLRHWDIGQHGVWGGLVPAERASLRRRWSARQPMSRAALA